MDMTSKKIIISFSIIALAFSVFYSYKTIRNRYFQEENKIKIEIETDKSSEKSDKGPEEFSNEDPENAQSENQTEETEEIIDPELQKLEEEEAAEEESALKDEEGDLFMDITKNDCDNNCEDYEDDEFEYCQEYCGLSNEERDGKEECSELEGLEMDYCYKNLAISKRDYEICDKIQDEGILKTCLNRVTEDIIDSEKEKQEE